VQCKFRFELKNPLIKHFSRGLLSPSCCLLRILESNGTEQITIHTLCTKVCNDIIWSHGIFNPSQGISHGHYLFLVTHNLRQKTATFPQKYKILFALGWIINANYTVSDISHALHARLTIYSITVSFFLSLCNLIINVIPCSYYNTTLCRNNFSVINLRVIREKITVEKLCSKAQ
jgi:hypothetical protein